MTTNCLFTARCPRTLKTFLVGSLPLFATNPASVPASAPFSPMGPPQLDQLVARIALYPDPLWVWRGEANDARPDKPDKDQKKLEKAVGEMFDHFPRKSDLP